MENNIEETWTFHKHSDLHHKHPESTNVFERLNEEIRQRTRVVRIFPNGDSCLRFIRALAVERHEDWLEGSRYLNMDFLAELKKEQLRDAARSYAHQANLLAQLDAHNPAQSANAYATCCRRR